MDGASIVSSMAFLECNSKCAFRDKSVPSPCPSCTAKIQRRIDKMEYIDTSLIETMCIVISNNMNDYKAINFTPLELQFAFKVLVDIIPFIKEKIDGSATGQRE